MSTRRQTLLTVLAISLGMTLAPHARAVDVGKLNAAATAALQQLYSNVPAARNLIPKAHAILIFPEITKAGLVVGGQYGEGVLIQPGKPLAYYNTVGASYGLQAGAQQFGYAMYFMNEKALTQLDKVGGFEVGAGPSVVLVDEGVVKQMSSTTVLNEDIYAFVFSQKGLMAGMNLQGNKITRITP